MVKLSGILEYSMGGFLCLRGFASYKNAECNFKTEHRSTERLD